MFYPGNWDTSGFLVTYLGIPIFLVLWLGHKLIFGRKDPWLYQPMEVDLTSGLREVEADAQMWAAPGNYQAIVLLARFGRKWEKTRSLIFSVSKFKQHTSDFHSNLFVLVNHPSEVFVYS